MTNPETTELNEPVDYAPTNVPGIDVLLKALVVAERNAVDVRTAAVVQGILADIRMEVDGMLDHTIRLNEGLRIQKRGGIPLDTVIGVNKTWEQSRENPLEGMTHVLNLRDVVHASILPEPPDAPLQQGYYDALAAGLLQPEKIKRMTRSSGRSTGPRGHIAIDRYTEL